MAEKKGNENVAQEPVGSVEITDKVINDYLFGSKTQITPEQRTVFMETAKIWQLNPFKREIYAVLYKNKSGGHDMSIVIGFEAFIRRGERSGRLDGWKVWIEDTGNGNPIGKILIHRKDWGHPFEYEIEWNEVAKDSPFWKKSGKEQLKKTVTAKGFRLCFSEELGGMPYTDIEMDGSRGKALPAPAEKDITPEPQSKVDGLLAIARGLRSQCRSLAKALEKTEKYSPEEWEALKEHIGWTGPEPTEEQANLLVGELQKDLQELRLDAAKKKGDAK